MFFIITNMALSVQCHCDPSARLSLAVLDKQTDLRNRVFFLAMKLISETFCWKLPALSKLAASVYLCCFISAIFHCKSATFAVQCTLQQDKTSPSCMPVSGHTDPTAGRWCVFTVQGQPRRKNWQRV